MLQPWQMMIYPRKQSTRNGRNLQSSPNCTTMNLVQGLNLVPVPNLNYGNVLSGVVKYELSLFFESSATRVYTLSFLAIPQI